MEERERAGGERDRLDDARDPFKMEGEEISLQGKYIPPLIKRETWPPKLFLPQVLNCVYWSGLFRL